jgi:hypothetical protein
MLLARSFLPAVLSVDVAGIRRHLSACFHFNSIQLKRQRTGTACLYAIITLILIRYDNYAALLHSSFTLSMHELILRLEKPRLAHYSGNRQFMMIIGQVNKY